MLELIDSVGIVERASRLSLSSAFQLTQDADGLPLLDVNPGAFLTQAAGDARYSQLGHTHTFASLTSKPTTIGGYGITDFNSLGDARWSALGHVHSGADITSGTIADARLSANIPKLNAISNAFSGVIQVAGPLFPIAIAGSPTNNLQIQIGSSSVFGVHGAMFSTGYQFISYNAYLNTSAADSWTQSLGSNPSGLFEVRPEGVAHYTAVAGKAVGNKATFWGTQTFSLTDGQLFLNSAAANPLAEATYQLRLWVTGSLRLGIFADGTYAYLQSFGSQPLYLNSQGNPVYIGAGGLQLQGGPVSGATNYLVANYGSGLVGNYDAAKYRTVYAMGSGFIMPAAGTSLTGFYGVAFVHDGAIALTGLSMGHGMMHVNNGGIRSFMGDAGFWTNGEMWVGSTRVAKVTWGSGAPAGSAPIGTIYIQTS